MGQSNLSPLSPCYVNPDEAIHTGCPHGMGGPRSSYYKGWFSELQNDMYGLEDKTIDKVLLLYDKQLIDTLNMNTLSGIKMILEKPFKYTPNDYIEGNKCVNKLVGQRLQGCCSSIKFPLTNWRG